MYIFISFIFRSAARAPGRSSHYCHWVTIVAGWRWEKNIQLTKTSWILKKMVSESHPESYPNHTSNFPILNLDLFARAELVFCEHKSVLHNHSPRATLPGASEKNPTAAAPCSGTLQWHQHTNSKAHEHTTLTAATWSSTLKHHPAAAPADQSAQATVIVIAVTCSNAQQHPTQAPLQRPQA